MYPSANPLSSTTPPFAPYASGVAGTPGPLPDYCAWAGRGPRDRPRQLAAFGGLQAMQPYYFPFVTEAPDGVSATLIGYFEGAGRRTPPDESIVVASSTDNGQTWTSEGTALRAERRLLPPGRHERRRAGSSDGDQGRRGQLPVHGEPAVGGQRQRGRSPRASGEPLHESNPLSGLNASEPVGVDPDIEATDAASVPTTGGATINVSSLGTTGSSELLAPGQNETDTAANSPGGFVRGRSKNLADRPASASVITSRPQQRTN